MLHLETLKLQEEEAYLWLCENRDLIEKYYDDIILEDIKVEDFYRKNIHIIEKIFPNHDAKLIKEGWLGFTMDLAFALGPAIPGWIGPSIAAAGTIYYLLWAYHRASKGDYLSATFDAMAAGFSAVQAIYGFGTLTGGAGKVGLGVLRSFIPSALARLPLISRILAGAPGTINVADDMTKMAAQADNIKAAKDGFDSLVTHFTANINDYDDAFKAAGLQAADALTEIVKIQKTLDNLNDVAKAAKSADDVGYLRSLGAFGANSGHIPKAAVDDLLQASDDVIKATLQGGTAPGKLGKAVTAGRAARTAKSAEQLASVAAVLKTSPPSWITAGMRADLVTTLTGTPAGALLSSGTGGTALIAGIYTSSRQLFQGTLAKLGAKIPGLLDDLSEELIKRSPSVFPPGSKILPNPTANSLKVLLPDGTAKYLKIFTRDGGGTYTDLGRFILNSSAYKRYVGEAATAFKGLVDNAVNKGLISPATIPELKVGLGPLVRGPTPAYSSSWITGLIRGSSFLEKYVLKFFGDPKNAANLSRRIALQASIGVSGASETLGSQMDYKRSDVLRSIARENN